MADLTIKRGDTWPPVDASLSDQNGPINLTTATEVRMLLKTKSGSTSYSRVCEITGPLAGWVRYAWTSGDASTGPTSVANTFNAEWEIEWADGTITTVPNEGYKEIVITPDLG